MLRNCSPLLAIFGWIWLVEACQTPSTGTESSQTQNATPVLEDHLSPATKLYFSDKSCTKPISVWQSMAGISDKDKILGPRAIWAMDHGAIRVSAQGSPLVQRQLERDGQFLAEHLGSGRYTQPFRSIRLSSEQASYSAELQLKFGDTPLVVGDAFAVGQLFRTGGGETTRVTLTLSPEQKAEDVFEWTQSAAADPRIDHNAPLKISADGPRLTLENIGPRGSSSSFAILQLKIPVTELKIQINSERKWPSGSADAIEIAFAEKECARGDFCRGIKSITKFEPGKGVSPATAEPAGLSQLLQSSAGSGIPLGKGGAIELELDGPLLNQEGKDLHIESVSKTTTCQDPAQRVRVFAKNKKDHVWQSVNRGKSLCGSGDIDLQLLHQAHFIRLEDASSSKTAKGYELLKIECPK